ncbi:hypothetical protein [Streptomyces sp. NBC_00091]|uniref:hypothetical protein n=1 Tax=Streptomyces sp. NBC_00091 TaxID=2975648 RepID=UPI00225B060C|nr:hypothetical protein [Streptomyces sp. NBC_00091]MCX5380969.1 hypothetical protein [Streptomyces sp. NBC_00091]
MLHTVLRRRANGETVEDVQPDLLIPTGRRKGQSPSLSSIYRALAEHAKTQAYPEAVETAHADFAALQQRDHSPGHGQDQMRRDIGRCAAPPEALTERARSAAQVTTTGDVVRAALERELRV